MTTGRINQVAFLNDGPAPHGPRAKTGTAVVRTKRRTLVFRDKQGANDPRAHRVFRIRENESRPCPGFPRDARRRTESGARPTLRGPPRVAFPRGSRRRAGTGHFPTADCHRDRYATQETDAGWVVRRPEPSTTEEASTARRRCPSRDPTCPRRPNATHAPNGKPCPAAARPRSLPPPPMGSGRTDRVHVRPNGPNGRAIETGLEG